MALYGRSVQAYRGRRNFFNLSYDKIFDGDIGMAYPFLFDEVLPGDIWKPRADVVVKLPILNMPVWQRFRVVKRFFFVTNRVACLAFSNQSGVDGPWIMDEGTLDYAETPWEHFITGGKSGTDTMHELVENDPHVFSKFTLFDYLGVPDGSVLQSLQISALRLCTRKVTAVYNAIYNAFFRNENFQSELPSNNTRIFQVNWEKDRYTSALSEQQRGVQPSISPLAALGDIPVGIVPEEFATSFTQARVRGFMGQQAGTDNGWLGASAFNFGSNSGFLNFLRRVFRRDDNQNIYLKTYFETIDQTENVGVGGVTFGDKSEYFKNADSWPAQVVGGIKFYDKLIARPSNDEPLFNVSDLRLMFQTQKFLEMNERAGYRYVEQLSARFGVRPQDSRLDRPLYLGGDKQDVVVTQINATDASNLGQFRGQGISAGKGKPVVLRAKEHGWIVGLVYVVPTAIYGSRIDPQFFAKSKFGYYTPEFAHLSEQPIFTKEIFPQIVASPNDKDNAVTDADKVFGFQGIYDEYRSKLSMVCGNFRSGGSLSDYTCQRFFNTEPTLSSAFLKVPSFRNLFVSTDPDAPPLYFFCHNDIKCWRKIPRYATPGLIDHS